LLIGRGMGVVAAWLLGAKRSKCKTRVYGGYGADGGNREDAAENCMW